MKKVLTFRPSSIGDCLMAIYLLENVRAAYPAARYGIVVAGRGAMIRDLLVAYPWIEVIEASRRNPRAVWHLLCNFWGSDFVFMPYTVGALTIPTLAIGRLLARRGALVGFADLSTVTPYLYDRLLPRPDRRNTPRLLEQRMLGAVGIPVGKEWMTYNYIPQPQLLPRLGLQKSGYIVVHLFSGSQTRGLDPEHQQGLVDALVREFPRVPLVFTGTAHDHGFIKQLRLSQGTVLPTTTVQEMAQIIDDSKGVVSVGTGPSHMASIMRRPLCVICVCNGLSWCGTEQYGDAPITIFARPDLCPDGHNAEGYARCMNTVDMDALAAKAKLMFSVHTSAAVT